MPNHLESNDTNNERIKNINILWDFDALQQLSWASWIFKTEHIKTNCWKSYPDTIIPHKATAENVLRYLN